MVEGWRTVNIRVALAEQIEKYLKTPEAKKLGLTSKSDFIEWVVRKELERG